MKNNILIKISYFILSILISSYFVYKLDGIKKNNIIIILSIGLVIYFIIVNIPIKRVENFAEKVDCEVSDWEIGSCSKPCGGGTRTNTRRVLQTNENGGEPCPADLVKVEACNTEPCPVDCQVSNWTAFTECSKKCGGGIKSRTRRIITEPQGDGKECPTNLKEVLRCNNQDCPIDCEVSDWDDWTPCDKNCGVGKMTRKRRIIEPPTNNGVKCPVLEESKECDNGPCPINCVVSNWSEWSECNQKCGGGQKYRNRTIKIKPDYGGDACPPLIDIDNCNTQPCPIDCQVSEWTDWSKCSKECGTGERTRTRTITVEPENGGKVCPVLKETSKCNTQPCPVDCEVGDWDEWAECSKKCGGGKTTRTKRIITPAKYGGKECPNILESKKCNEDPCPIDCKVGDWGGFGKCSKTCGGGTKIRTRIIKTTPKYGGEKCPVLQDTAPCNTDPCPINCKVSDWGPWNECSKDCDGGVKTRSRIIITKPKYGGEDCPNLTETAPCNEGIPCVIDCKVSEWSPWSECSKKCGKGKKTRTRKILEDPQNGGEECPKLIETVYCNTDNCPENCVVSGWSKFTKCSAQCGGGTQTRTREIISTPKYGGKECPGLTEIISCNTQPCPVDCIVSDWAPFSECSAACDGGIMKRKRKVVTEPENGGKPCPDLVESVPCNTQICPSDCVVSEWGPWSICDKNCGESYRTRRRKVLVPSKGGGKGCPVLVEKKRCNTLPCPVDCKVSDWGEWSKCSKKCGGGEQYRKREVLIDPQGGGDQCPVLIEKRECNEDKC